MKEKTTTVEVDQAPATVEVTEHADQAPKDFPGPYPGLVIHNHPPLTSGSTSLRQQIIGGAITLGVAGLGVYGLYLSNKVSDVQTAVAEVHELTNSQFTALQAELAAAKDVIADLREIIGGMVPAPAGGLP